MTDNPAPWQLIETCPAYTGPDMPKVWVWGGVYYKRPTITRPDGSWWRARRRLACVEREEYSGPTHWMPVEYPEPPDTDAVA